MRYCLGTVLVALLLFAAVLPVSAGGNPLAGTWVNSSGTTFQIPVSLSNPFKIRRTTREGRTGQMNAQWVKLGKSFKVLYSKDGEGHVTLCTLNGSDPNTIDITRDGKAAEHWMRQK